MALRDAIYGVAVGDALGVPYEFRERGTFRCEGMIGYEAHWQPAGTWSDDTALTLATCASIKVCSAINTADILERFREWYNDGEYAIDNRIFDIGGTTKIALFSGEGRTSFYSNGNGSLMRIAPLAYTDASDDEIRAVSAITHAHEISTETCVKYVRLLRRVREDAQTVLAELRSEELPEVYEGSSHGYVLDTYRAALWCFATSGSYRECVLKAVNLGHDADTTAAVAGALAGECYGYGSIPEEWLEALRGKDIIERCLF